MPSRPVLVNSILVLAAGFALYEASPPRSLWWLAPLAFAPLAWVVRGRRARAGFGYGLLFGLAYLLPLLGWLLDFLGAQFGPWPWLGVALVEALFFGLAGAGMARVSRLPAAPVWAAAVFVGAELLRTLVPFGGFPWGRLAFTQNEGLLLPLASVGGAGLVTFVVALIGAGVAEAASRLGGGLRGLIGPSAAILVPVVAGLAVSPLIGTDANAGVAKVAVVQGNAPNVGLDLLYQDDVLHTNHMVAAENLLDDVRSGRVAKPDLVVLPEQVGAWGPSRRDPELDLVTSELGVPVVAGGLTEDRQGQVRNSIVQREPGRGVTAEYVKQHLVPFAETIPLRPLARLVTPFVDRFQKDMVPGTEPGVLGSGALRLGVGLCFDVAYDDVFTGAARSGATLFAVPTNNAWYGQSEMSYQHVAMSQLRAVEHGRAVLVSATSGVSAVIEPDGSINQHTSQFTAATLHAQVPLRSTTTWATELGGIPTWLLASLGVGAVAVTLRRPRRD
jgi:apolipoprotein N-acyltransferase